MTRSDKLLRREGRSEDGAEEQQAEHHQRRDGHLVTEEAPEEELELRAGNRAAFALDDHRLALTGIDRGVGQGRRRHCHDRRILGSSTP